MIFTIIFSGLFEFYNRSVADKQQIVGPATLHDIYGFVGYWLLLSWLEMDLINLSLPNFCLAHVSHMISDAWRFLEIHNRSLKIFNEKFACIIYEFVESLLAERIS